MSTGSGTSSDTACLHTPEYLSASNSSLSASMSTASCSSPNELTQAVPLQEAVRTCKRVGGMSQLGRLDNHLLKHRSV